MRGTFTRRSAQDHRYGTTDVNNEEEAGRLLGGDLDPGQVGGASARPGMESAGGGQRPWWEQFKATVMRNVTIKKRQKRRTAAEIITPIYIFAILAIVRAVQPETHYAAVLEPQGSGNIISDPQLSGFFSLYIVPDKAEHRDFSRRLETMLEKQGHMVNVTLLPSEAALLKDPAVRSPVTSALCVVLPDRPGTNLTYTLRLAAAALPAGPEGTDMECRGGAAGGPLQRYCSANDYFYSRFLTLQNSIDAVMIQLRTNSSRDQAPTDMTLVDGPKAAFSSSSSDFLKIFVPLYMVISLSQFITYLLVLIVGEKETKIKDGLKQMGLRDSVYWLSWFLLYAVYVFVVASICIIIMYLSKVFPNSNNIYIYIIYVVYGWSLVMFGFMLTPFFHKAKVAGGVGNMAVTVLSLLFLVQVYINDLPPAFFWVLSLLSPVAFTFGIERAVDLDTARVGLNSDNVWEAAGGMPFGGAIIMIVIDIFLYAFLAFYLDNIIPNEYGRRESPLFIFKKSYWFGANKALLLGEDDREYVSVDQEATNPNVEPVSSDVRGKVALRLFALRKQFTSNGEKIVAVNDLSLDMYEGQITAILGHNGAGKTTLFNMLTGLTQPTSGTATIYGLDITAPHDMRALWSMTGICPQHDILVEDMSPREHLVFLARLRGVPPDREQAEVAATLADVDLTEKADEPVRGLSGGQKRKLSVGQALIGDPRIVVLDEPTAGVDPYSRRRLWSLLQRRKQGRLVLLSTHFMDEADILADRKAIISTGRLRCCGSSMFLKSRFGLGYHLTIVAGDSMSAPAVDAVVAAHVPEREKGRVHGHELTFVLPMNSVSCFPGLFAQLEEQQNQLGVQSFGISQTTLEEVFLQLASDDETTPADGALASVTRGVLERRTSAPCPAAAGDGETIVLSERAGRTDDGSVPQLECRPSASRTMLALLRIRLINLWRVPGTFVFMVCIPVALMVGGLLLNRNSGGSGSDQASAAVLLNNETYPNYNRLLYLNNTSSNIDGLLAGWGMQPEPFDGAFTAILNDSRALATLTLRSHSSLTAVVRDKSTHSPAIVLNAINNGRLSEALSSPLTAADRLTVISHPLPRDQNGLQFDGSIFGSSILVGFLFLFVPISIAGEFVQERELRIRNALRVNGLSFNMYFFSYFIILFSLFSILWLVMLIVVQAADVTLLSPGPAFSMLAVLYFEYMLVGLLWACVLSYMFDKLDTAMSVYPNLATMGGMLPYMVVTLLDTLVGNGDGTIANPIHYTLCIIDPFYIPMGVLYFISKTRLVVQLLEGRTPDYGDYWGEPVFVVPLVVMLVQIPLLWWLLRVVDARKQGHSTLTCLPSKRGAGVTTDDPPEDAAAEQDSDVLQEQARVDAIMMGRHQGPTPVIAAQSLSKTYPAKKTTKASPRVLRAVGGVSFAVDAGEVFGLLGPNGAGKTTTMRMVIAEEAPSSGQIEVAGQRVTNSLSEAFHLLGYCPQFDAQWKYITVEEHVRCFARIRGLSAPDVERVTNHYIEGLQIREHAAKRSMQCSGGTKRKLSYALSMLGVPRLVLLDEPSTGMDPQSKRFLWDTIAAGFRGDRGAILTTHSMEEADALCNRLGIMVRGRLRCLGSTQHLKNKYGGGYVLEVKLTIEDDVESRMEKVKQMVSGLFASAEVEEEFGERIRYRIPQQDVTSLSHGFSQLEEAKARLGMEEYSLSQTTLEQVFLRFAREQEMDD